MERKYPVSFFFLGVFQNCIQYFFLGLIGLILLIIGVIGVHICKIIGVIVLVCYFSLCIIKQLFIRSASLKESDNTEYNKFMDGAFGENKHDENALCPHKKIINMVENVIKTRDKDFRN